MDRGKVWKFPKYNSGLLCIDIVHHLLNEVDNSTGVCKVQLLMSWQFHCRSLHQYNSSIHALPEDPLLDCMYQLDNQWVCQHLAGSSNQQDKCLPSPQGSVLYCWHLPGKSIQHHITCMVSQGPIHHRPCHQYMSYNLTCHPCLSCC